ncbi:hypothetical protein KAR91_72545 [Candidatus Pacearchaeota archaeon]|nr:hypothetical protein [Candidatus Pacearchaeota archaeon]
MKKYFPILTLSLLLIASTVTAWDNTEPDDVEQVTSTYQDLYDSLNKTKADLYNNAGEKAGTTDIHGIADTSKLTVKEIQTVSVDDAGTYTPTAGDVTISHLTCLSNPSAITWGEGSATSGDIAIVINVGSNLCTFPYSESVFHHKGGVGKSLGLSQLNGAIVAEYTVDRWVVIDNESDTLFLKSIGAGIYKELEVNAVDGTYDGVVITRTVDSGATSLFGQALHVDTDGEMIVADADVASAGSMPALCLAVEAGTGSKKCLLNGTITETDWNWTIGAFIYIDDDPTENEGLTEVAGIPATAGDQVQVVGIALTADTIHVDMGGLVLVEVP